MVPVMLFALAQGAADIDPSPNGAYGPFRMNTLSPISSVRSGFAPRPPQVLSEEEFEVRAAGDWGNVWAEKDGKYFLDYEAAILDVSVAHGLGGGFVAELAFVEGWRFGGTLDPLIVGFHDLVHAKQMGRGDVPENDFRFELQPGHGRSAVAVTSEGSFTRAVMGSLQYTYPGERYGLPALSGAISLRGGLEDSGDLDGGSPAAPVFSLSGSKRIGKVYLYLAGDVAWFGTQNYRGLPLRPVQFSGFGAVEWKFSRRVSGILQYLATEGSVEHFKAFSYASNQIALGVKWEPDRGVLVEAAILENLISPHNSADFGFHLGMTLRW
jgi:uncharacterized protein DUF3187